MKELSEYALEKHPRNLKVMTVEDCRLCDYCLLCAFHSLFETFPALQGIVWSGHACGRDIITGTIAERVKEETPATSPAL